MKILVVHSVFHSGIRAVGFSVAEARKGAGIAKRRERVGAAHRIVGDEAVQRQRGHAADGERTESRIADAEVPNRVIKLAGAARVAVCVLEGERSAIVLHERPRTIDEVAGIGVEPGFQRADERPARKPRNRLLHIDADDRLVDPVGRPQPLGAVALLADEVRDAVAITRVETRAIGSVAEADVERRIDGEARVAQGTIRRACI